MGHILHWTPGTYGKGIVTPEGDVHTWNTDPITESPHHSEYVYDQLGIPDTGFSLRSYRPFEITPEGYYLPIHESPGDLEKIDPRLKYNGSRWNFESSINHKVGKITVHEVGQPCELGKKYHGNRRPFTYFPNSQRLIIGPEGSSHFGHMYLKSSIDDEIDAAQGGLYRTPSGENVIEFYLGAPDPDHIANIAKTLGANQAQLNDWHIGEEVHNNPDKTWHWDFQSKVIKNNHQWQFKIGMPVSEEFWNKWPGELYHGTSPDRLESIMQHGLHPWDSPVAGGSRYDVGEKWIQPRPGHVYLDPDASEAWQKARGVIDPQVGEPIVFRIDPSKLDPQGISPDEDVMYKYWPHAPRNQDVHWRDEIDKSLGDYAEKHGWGNDPMNTQQALNDQQPIAYRGVIPPEALIPGKWGFDYSDNPPREIAWRPMLWPPKIASSNHLEWKPGSWGKGLYFPETGFLQIWGDDRTHSDVWFDDENYSQPGEVHHLIIHPDGAVENQGAINRHFEDTEGDIVGLEKALENYNPQLHLNTSDWSFGPTEPMEEEPSSISRGEEGGKDAQTVQTANDFAGSL